MTDELYHFLACDYYATGEARTVALLVTRAYPWADDTETSAEFRAQREFTVKFGGFLTQGVEHLSRDEFLDRFEHHLPGYVQIMLRKGNDKQPGNFNFATEIHINLS